MMMFLLGLCVGVACALAPLAVFVFWHWKL